MLIADIGSGPASKIEVHCADRRGYPGIDVQDMEELDYEDNFFDMVYCENALDHTPDALKALKELIRISGDLVYIKCWLDQKQTGHRHYWDAKEDGCFTNGETEFHLKDFGFSVKYTDTGGERRYSYITAVLRKP